MVEALWAKIIGQLFWFVSEGQFSNLYKYWESAKGGVVLGRKLSSTSYSQGQRF